MKCYLPQLLHKKIGLLYCWTTTKHKCGQMPCNFIGILQDIFNRARGREGRPKRDGFRWRYMFSGKLCLKVRYEEPRLKAWRARFTVSVEKAGSCHGPPNMLSFKQICIIEYANYPYPTYANCTLFYKVITYTYIHTRTHTHTLLEGAYEFSYEDFMTSGIDASPPMADLEEWWRY